MAVLSALFATVLLMGLGVSIVLIGTTEATLAARDRAGRALREAALAAAHLAVADLRIQPAWSAVLAAGSVPERSAAPGRAIDPTLAPAAPWGGAPLDLRALTADVQAAADTGVGDPQVWRLYESGSLPSLAPAVLPDPWYLAVWVADDSADGDGNPLVDVNGILAIRAVALGPHQARVTTAVSVLKFTDSGGLAQVRILTVRPAT